MRNKWTVGAFSLTMDARRARAYATSLSTIASLHAREQDALRQAADALVFACEPYEPAVAGALRTADRVVDQLVDRGRLEPDVADRIVAELEACGPELPATQLHTVVSAARPAPCGRPPTPTA